MSSSTVLHLSAVSKTYGGLRPLRIRRLAVAAAEAVALAGFDQTTAEVFVNLVTGATLPEEGAVHVFGRATADIADSDDWLSTVDRFGIVSERVVLLDQFTPLQNIAMALTLDVDPLSGDVREQAASLAESVGLAADVVGRPVAEGSVAVRHRVRLARALATTPSILLVEHPVAGLDVGEVAPLAADLRRVARARSLTVVVLAADAALAAPFGSRVLTLNGGTGELTETKPGLLERLFGKS
jgi:ABC-type transporter Mla maintaining outer membrane lipid asymmetry ATPase subunit MlaF